VNLGGLFAHGFEGGPPLREVIRVGADVTGIRVQIPGDRLRAGPRPPGIDETQHEFRQVAAEVDLGEQGRLLFVGAQLQGSRDGFCPECGFEEADQVDALKMEGVDARKPE